VVRVKKTGAIDVQIDRQGRDRQITKAEITRRVTAMIKHLQMEKMEVSIALTGDDQIQKLNKLYRGKDRPTDVLSFSMREGEFATLAGAVLGDVIVSVPTARAQAMAQKKDLMSEITMLLAHGLLQLLGWDHDTDAKDRKMRAKTDELCAAAILPVSKRSAHRKK
jgi:probable rRNA maturation factor